MFRRGTVLTVVTIVVLICAVYAAAAHSKSKNKPVRWKRIVRCTKHDAVPVT